MRSKKIGIQGKAGKAENGFEDRVINTIKEGFKELVISMNNGFEFQQINQEKKLIMDSKSSQENQMIDLMEGMD